MPTVAEAGRKVSVRGLEIFVRERGEGYPLLLINGIGANLDMLDATETALTRRSRERSFDARERAARRRRSSRCRSCPSPASPATCSTSSITRRPTYSGSRTGASSHRSSRIAPERVRRLALVSTACGWGSRLGDPAALSALATPLRYYSRSFGARTSRLYGERDSIVDASLRGARVGSPPSLLGYAYQLLAAATWSSLPWLATLRQPTLGGRRRRPRYFAGERRATQRD